MVVVCKGALGFLLFLTEGHFLANVPSIFVKTLYVPSVCLKMVQEIVVRVAQKIVASKNGYSATD